MKRYIYVLLAGLFCLNVIGCGSGGVSQSPSVMGPPVVGGPPPLQAGLNIASGDSQTGIIGSQLAQPLTVSVADDASNPIQGVNVQFLIKSGSAILSGTTAATGPDGRAAINVTLVGSLTPIKIEATSPNSSSATFSVTPRLPNLGEVVDSTTNGDLVAFFPAALATLDNGDEVMVLLKGTDPAIDTDFIPSAGELLGGMINGLPADDYPVVFLPIGALSGAAIPQPAPIGSAIKPLSMVENTGANMPVVTSLLVNGDSAVVAIIGDASGITSNSLGSLIDANTIVNTSGTPTAVANLPVFIIHAADFPANPADDDYSYFAASSKKIPFFNAALPVTGATATGIPSSQSVLPTTSATMVILTDGVAAHGLLLYKTPPLTDTMAPEATLQPLPTEFLDAFNIIEDEIAPLIEANQQFNEEIFTDMEALGHIFQDNQDLINQFMQGGGGNPFDLLPLAGQVLPHIDNIVNNALDMLPNIEQQLTIFLNQVLPAIEAGLPEDGGVFGGYSDGEASNIRDDVIPMIEDQIENMLDAMPAIENLLQDLDDLIPSDGSVITLMFNIASGDLNNVLDDIVEIVPYIANGLQIFDDQGIPILYDLLEEAEHNNQPGHSPVSDTPGFQSLVAMLEAAYPPGTTLGDLPGFDQFGPMLGSFLPADWGNPADVSLFDTLIPALGQVDIGEDILPVIRDGLDALDGALPGIIAMLNDFDGFDFNFDFF